MISTIAGNGNSGFSGDGGLATSATLKSPSDIAIDGNGNIYIADVLNFRIRKVNSFGIISTIAGNGIRGYTGDGGLAMSAQISTVSGIAVDKNGNVYISVAEDQRIRKIDSSGIITTIAGNGVSLSSGDGGLAVMAQIFNPEGIIVDKSRNIYFAQNGNNTVRRIDPAGIITTIAGNGSAGFSGDGGFATSAQLSSPSDVAVDMNGNIYISDKSNARIRKVNSSGIISTIAGNGTTGFSGDGNSASLAQFKSPKFITVDSYGDLFISDVGNARIRQTYSGLITTIAGNGISSYSGDSVWSNLPISDPAGLLTQDNNDSKVIFCDPINNRILKIRVNSMQGDLTTESATNVTTTTATLNATVKPIGGVSTYLTLRYSTVEAEVHAGNGIVATSTPMIISGNSWTPVSSNITGLSASTRYYFRASVRNPFNSISGATHSFTTAVAPVQPLVTTESATNISTSSSTLNGTVNPRGSVTTSLSIRYSVVKAEVDSGNGTLVSVSPSTVSGLSVTSISSSVTGLTPGTTYFFRASAITAGGTANGATLSFTTATPIPQPLVLTLPASSIGLNTATINGSVNTKGSNTTQLTLKYSQVKSEIEAGSGTSPIVTPSSISGNAMAPISSSLFGLLPNTTYFYRASASTPGGTVNGVILTFTTVSKADILVPSAFSPNGDGQNDILIPILLGIQKFGYFMVLNRWGQVVFETREMGKGWDGNYRSNPQPMDTYSWVVEGVDFLGKTIKKNGGALLVR